MKKQYMLLYITAFRQTLAFDLSIRNVQSVLNHGVFTNPQKQKDKTQGNYPVRANYPGQFNGVKMNERERGYCNIPEVVGSSLLFSSFNNAMHHAIAMKCTHIVPKTLQGGCQTRAP
ncbi:hypothetical protein TNCV_1151771 [Trichonephila clavipes]|nr:hypothetical protein TNCV_1151771 [Trichonephila clavipes]